MNIMRNEDAPFYFEKILAALDFLDLLETGSLISRLQIKPDRKHGSNRRIEDLTKFYKDGGIEVVQMKHTLVSNTHLNFSDLWTVAIKTPQGRGGRKEGTNIFKFLKSWRFHRKSTPSIMLTLVSNKKPSIKLNAFFKDIRSLQKKKKTWKSISNKYGTQIQSIEANCSQKPFVSKKELREFISALNYKHVSDINDLEKELEEKLKGQGIAEKARVQAFITRVTKKFVSNNIDILPSDVVALIDRVKTGLLQEIAPPINYIQRPELEKKILAAIESRKKEGGFILLFSPSGSGKTVLLSRLAEKNPDFFPYFCRIRPFEAVRNKSGYSNTNRLSSTWFKADIIQRCYEFGLLSTSVSVTDSEDFIDKTFDESLSILSQKAQERPGKKIVIIVDALDQVETDRFKGKSVLDAIPAVKQPGVVFVLSTWGERYLPTSIKNLPKSTKEDVGIDLFFTEKEITGYFKQVKIPLTQYQVSIIKKKTNGLAISIFYLAQKLKSQTDIDQIINSPGQYDEVFEWYKPIWSSLAAKEQECLGYLCFHFAKVKRDDLWRAVQSRLISSKFNKLLLTISPFIDTFGAFIEPYHDSFRRFVVSHLSKDKTFYHRNLADYYSANSSESSYGKKYTIKHLEAVGLNDSTVKRIYRRLDSEKFFEKVLKSNLDDPTKVEIGKSFVSYFYTVKEIKKFLKYAILSSNIYPTVYEEHAYKKAYIGTEKLIAEVENELLLPKRQHIRDQREWVFKRLAVGNILKTKSDKNSLSLASRFLDDSLFRIHLNPQLLWEEDAMREFWNHAKEITEAYVNTGQYVGALAFLKKGIGFKKKTKKIKGLIASKVAKVHLQNLQIDRKETLNQVAKSSKIERLLFYIALTRSGERVPNLKDLKKLLDDEKMESYIHDENNDRQYIDLAKTLITHNAKNNKVRIEKILRKLKADIPYYSRGYIYWGDMGGGRDIYLNWVALKSFVDKNFNLEDFYKIAFKEKFNNRSDLSEHENPAFVEILLIQSELYKNAMLVQMGKMDWKNYWSPFKSALIKYKEKIDQIKRSTNSYGSDLQKTCYPYYYDLSDLIRENLTIINAFFPAKLLSVVSKIEEIIGMNYLYKDPVLLEMLIRTPTAKVSSKLRDKTDVYFEKLLDIRQKEALDNLGKSNNLQDIATLAAKKNRLDLAEDVYIQSLKYSRGLWSKGDLRFSNFVDSARTQKRNQLDFVLRCIEKVSDIVEGGWYWRLDLLESAAYTDYKLALDYAYDFIIKGEVNQNEALVRIISTYIKNNPYSSLGDILPIVSLINFKDESGHEPYENISKAFYMLIRFALNNGDYGTVDGLVKEYFKTAKRDVHPRSQINIFRDFIKFADPYPTLRTAKKEFESHINTLEKVGYQPAAKSSSEYEVTYDGIDLKKLRACAKKDQAKAVINIIDAYVQKPGYFTNKLVAGIVPFLSTASIEKIRDWARQKKVDIEGAYLFIALIKKALSENNQSILRKTCSDIVRFQSAVEHFHSSHLINDLNEIQFPGKRTLIKKLLLISIRNYAGDGYSLTSVFSYSSEAIDDNYIDIKKWSYEVWKDVVEKSMRLSLTK